MVISLDSSLQEIMEERGILESDIRQVVEAALSGEPHLKSDDGKEFLAKKKLETVTVYAHFSQNGDDVVVDNVYSHRVVLNEDLA